MDTILDNVKGPDDVKHLSAEGLDQLAREVRETIIETVSRTGGHLASNLGVVELTVALLRVFNPPRDRIIWDVGHQGYAFKILTGRREQFSSLRQFGGVSGFLKREESKYDAFGAGHSGTALSAALGMAVARDRRGGGEHVVAVVGDAAVGNGISLEALNNVTSATRRLIVVLNDNEMSIDANVGAISRSLGKLLANPRYNRWKSSVESVATKLKMGFFRSAYYRVEGAVKSLFLRSGIFEEFGLRYVGPIDGHDLRALTDALLMARDYNKPMLLHVSTRKGKGYTFAEQKPDDWHGTPCFDIEDGEKSGGTRGLSYSAAFGKTLERLADEDQRIVAVTAAMAAGTGLSGFAGRFPGRFFDVGISEEHAVIFSAGLAAEGLVPVFAVYSTFLQRAVDCVIHDVCLQNLPVVFCLDRAGAVGDDGPTHHGLFDIPLLRPVPGLVFMQPRDVGELPHMLYTAVRLGRPVVIRYPRGGGRDEQLPQTLEELALGKAEVLREGGDVQIWGLGDMTALAGEVADLLQGRGIRAGVVNARFVRPLDTALLEEHARAAGLIVTIENGVLAGGFGSAVAEHLNVLDFRGSLLRFGWPDAFVPHGSVAELMQSFGLVPEKIASAVIGARRRADGPVASDGQGTSGCPGDEAGIGAQPGASSPAYQGRASVVR